MPHDGDEHGRPRRRRPRLVDRAQRTGTAPAGPSVALVVLFAGLAVLVSAPAIIDGAPQLSLPLIALAMTSTLLADLLRPELGRYAMWLRLLGVVVSLAALLALSLHLWT